jgi:prenyltransferase beta subunit
MTWGFIMDRIHLAASVLLFWTAALPAQAPEQKKVTIKFVQDLQVSDGGFVPAPVDGRLDQNPKGSLRATSSALRALKYFGGAAKDKKACEKFVQECFDGQIGGFSDQPGGKTDVFTTAVGLMAVVELGLPIEKYRDAAINYMADTAKEFEERRMAAAGMEAAGKRHPASRQWLIDLQNRANKDGSYGAGAMIPRATGGTVATILRLGGKPVEPDSVIDILNAGQNKDGAFGKDETHESDLETSYRIMRCYHMLKAKPAKSDALREFVGKCRNSDGGYGVQPGKPSQVSGTYFASIILHWLNEP